MLLVKVDPRSDGRQNENKRVASLESVSIYLKYTMFIYQHLFQSDCRHAKVWLYMYSFRPTDDRLCPDAIFMLEAQASFFIRIVKDQLQFR